MAHYRANIINSNNKNIWSKKNEQCGIPTLEGNNQTCINNFDVLNEQCLIYY